MSGYHTRWSRPLAGAGDPERIAIREVLALGKAVYDRRGTLGLTVAEVAFRAGMSADDIECIEEGGTEPAISLLCHLAALDAHCPRHALVAACFDLSGVLAQYGYAGESGHHFMAGTDTGPSRPISLLVRTGTTASLRSIACPDGLLAARSDRSGAQAQHH